MCVDHLRAELERCKSSDIVRTFYMRWTQVWLLSAAKNAANAASKLQAPGAGARIQDLDDKVDLKSLFWVAVVSTGIVNSAALYSTRFVFVLHNRFVTVAGWPKKVKFAGLQFDAYKALKKRQQLYARNAGSTPVLLEDGLSAADGWGCRSDGEARYISTSRLQGWCAVRADGALEFKNAPSDQWAACELQLLDNLLKPTNDNLDKLHKTVIKRFGLHAEMVKAYVLGSLSVEPPLLFKVLESELQLYAGTDGTVTREQFQLGLEVVQGCLADIRVAGQQQLASTAIRVVGQRQRFPELVMELEMLNSSVRSPAIPRPNYTNAVDYSVVLTTFLNAGYEMHELFEYGYGQIWSRFGLPSSPERLHILHVIFG